MSLEEEKFFSNTVMGYATVTEEEPKSATDPCYRLSIRRYLSWPSSGDGKINKDDPFYLVTEREKSPLSDIGGFDRRMLGSLIYIPALTKTEEQLRLGEETPFGVLIKQLVTSRIEATEQFQSIRDNLEALNAVGRRRRGVFREFSQKLNANLTDWEATAGLSLMLPKAEDLLKSSLQLTFSDLTVTDGKSMGLDQFGLGFQRTVINELIRMLAEGEDEDHGDPSPLKIVLYEEPEAFMHPCQQAALFRNLRCLAQEPDYNVLVTSHSSVFASKNAANLGTIARLFRTNGRARAFQTDRNQIDRAIKDYTKQLNLTGNFDWSKGARDALFYQVWLENERSCLFFADKVLMVEGPTERVVLSYLLENEWSDLLPKLGNFQILEVGGKYNFVRFAILLRAFGIHFRILLDDDGESRGKGSENLKQSNRDIRNFALSPDWRPYFDGAKPEFMTGCIEEVLGVPIPINDKTKRPRNDLKPASLLAAIEQGKVNKEKLLKLREHFVHAMGLDHRYIKMPDRNEDRILEYVRSLTERDIGE